MYWYCPHMHVVILDCLKANWPKFSPYSCQCIWTADDLYAFTEYEGVHVRNCYIKMWNHYNSPLPRCRGHQSSGYVCWPLEGERCPRCHEIYSLLLDFLCGCCFIWNFAVFLFFVIFNCRNCLIYNLKCHQKKKLNCKKEIDLFAMMESKHKKFTPQEKGFRQMRLNFKWRSVKKKMQYLVAKVYFKTLFAISISCYITWISLNQVCDENYFF